MPFPLLTAEPRELAVAVGVSLRLPVVEDRALVLPVGAVDRGLASGSDGATPQLVQAMADFGGSSATNSLNTAPVPTRRSSRS
jgi:hypothetical protein